MSLAEAVSERSGRSLAEKSWSFTPWRRWQRLELYPSALLTQWWTRKSSWASSATHSSSICTTRSRIETTCTSSLITCLEVISDITSASRGSSLRSKPNFSLRACSCVSNTSTRTPFYTETSSLRTWYSTSMATWGSLTWVSPDYGIQRTLRTHPALLAIWPPKSCAVRIME